MLSTAAGHAAPPGTASVWPWSAAAWRSQANPQQPSVEDPEVHTQMIIQPTVPARQQCAGVAVEQTIMAATPIAKVGLWPFGCSSCSKHQQQVRSQLLRRQIGRVHKQPLFLVACVITSPVAQAAAAVLFLMCICSIIALHPAVEAGPASCHG